MIPWDLDNSFLGAILGFTNPTTLYQRDPYYTGTIGDRPLAYNLMNDPFYRKQYTAHLRTIINESLDTSIIRGSINTLQSLAHNAVDSDQNKQYSTSEYYSNVENHIGFWWRNGGIMETIDGRKAYLLSHPEISLIPPTINNVAVNNSLVTAEVIGSNTVALMATKSKYNSKFQAFAMLDDGLNGDALAGDNVFTATLPFQGSGNDVKFYIRAENNDAMKLNPERAEYEFYIHCVPHIWQQALSICDGDNIIIGTNTYSIAGNYTDTLFNSNGCDSIVYTNLSIMPPIIWQQALSICDGDSIVIGNNTYSIAGNYTDTLLNFNGCDSILYTNIAIDYNTTSFDTLITNTSIVVWNGMNLTTAGDYTFLLTNSVNCDSIAHLNLIFENPSNILTLSNNKNKVLIKITNVLGEPTRPVSNTPLFYIYDDGTVEKKIIIK
jgi:hypothetical protein